VPNDTLSQVHLHRLLDSVFQAIILLVGLDDLVAQRHVERTKRDLRVNKYLVILLAKLDLNGFTVIKMDVSWSKKSEPKHTLASK
jgi:hypothetical protein